MFLVCYSTVLDRTMRCDFDKSKNCSFCLRPKSISDFPRRFCELDSAAATRHCSIAASCSFVTPNVLSRSVAAAAVWCTAFAHVCCIVGFANLHDPNNNCAVDDVYRYRPRDTHSLTFQRRVTRRPTFASCTRAMTQTSKTQTNCTRSLAIAQRPCDWCIILKLENVSMANALQLEAARRHTLPVRFYTSPVASLKSLSLSVAVFTVDTPRCAVTLNFYPVTLTFDLWPWTYVEHLLRHGQTLYQIWSKSDNPRQSYCDLNIWPYDLEDVSRAPICCGIVCTKCKLSQAIRSWNVTVFSC